MAFIFVLDRYILVDIDDIFVGREAHLTPADVQHMIESQDRLAQVIPGFR